MSTTLDRSDKIATHFDGCWESPKHHGCAVAEIHRLRALAAHYRAEGMREAAGICEKRRIDGIGFTECEAEAEGCRDAILAAIKEG